LKEDTTLAELSATFDIHANQITEWRTKLLEAQKKKVAFTRSMIHCIVGIV
jgi:transposase-like protein